MGSRFWEIEAISVNRRLTGRTWGLMSSMALGLAPALPHRKVVALRRRLLFVLNLGSLATIANQHPRNLIHIAFDNECYESSRGAPTATAGQADLATVAWGCGIDKKS
jgi:sulfopyruvate decarboxylase subunit beta